MEDGPDACAHLARAAAALAVLSLLPVALHGSAPSHASAVLPPISSLVPSADSAGVFPWSSPLFAAFRYDRGQVLGTYVQFAYDDSSGTVRSVLGLAGDALVLYVGSIEIAGFAPARGASAHGPTFQAEGDVATVAAHADPTARPDIRTVARPTAALAPSW